MKNFLNKYKLELGGLVLSIIGYGIVTSFSNFPEWVEVPFRVGVIVSVAFGFWRYIKSE